MRAILVVLFIGLWTNHVGAQNEQPILEGEPVAEPRQEEGASASEQRATPEQDSTSQLLPAIRSIETAIRDLIAEEDEIARQKEEARNDADLRAQEDMAWWAKLMFFAAAGSLLLTGIGVLLIWRTLLATQAAANAAVATVDAATDANVTTREVAEAQARAYLSVIRADIAIDTKPRPAKEFEHVEVTMHFHNSGSTPAINVSYYCHAETSVWGHISKFEPLDTVHSQEYINNIPPHTTTKVSPSVFGILKELWNVKKKWEAHTDQTPIGEIPILIVKGVVFYNDVFGAEFRSQFCFWLENQPSGKKEHGQDDLPTIQTQVPTFERIESRNLYVKHDPED